MNGRTASLLIGATLLVVASASCSDSFSSCQDTRTCESVGGSGGEAQAGAYARDGGSTAGEAGNASGGDSVAGRGGNAAAAGEAGAGAGGGGAKLPCDGACVAPKAVCDEPTDTCVECLDEGDCAAAGAKPKCDTTAKACVECLAATDCSDAAAAKCDAGACVKCTGNDDCAHVAGKTVCDTDAGECVQCTGKDYASCGMSAGKPLVCDTTTRSCTSTKEHSADLCLPCVSDAQCALGQLCVKEQFGEPKEDVGNFCFWQQGAPSGDAPADCTLPANIPYVAALKNQVSIDGTMATICGLRSSTCIARSEFSSKDCSTASAADNDKCGFSPGKDSKCLAFGASQFRCSMACVSGDDCAGGLGCGANSFCKLEP